MAARIFLLILIMLLSGCGKETGFAPLKVMVRRPAADQLFFDYTGLMDNVAESTRRHLQHIRDDYGIEMVIAAFPTLDDASSIKEAATTVFTNWDIGRQFGARGMLILLADDIKQVKIEIGFELEDVFTDAFCGHIEDLQLQPRFAAGQLNIGIIAMMEELEERARAKYQGSYSPASIAAWDAKYLSQGAGARQRLDTPLPSEHFGDGLKGKYPAGETPSDAWQTMIRCWKDKVRDPDLGVYTPVTRLTYRDFIHLPDARYEEDYRTYASKKYEVLENGKYAVIYFGKKKGWDNAPFLMCRTKEGWQFDIVHQKRYIRMGRAPDWGVEFSEHPHMAILMDTYYFNGQDIPYNDEDRYTVERDTELAHAILMYEERLKTEGDAPSGESLVALGRLYTIVSLNQKAMPLLQKALSRLPDDARPHKYLAIAHVDAHYQYDAAIKEIKTYTRMHPRDIFGHQFLGYLYYRKNMFKESRDAFKQALALDPEDCYAHFYLCYVYAALYRENNKDKSFKVQFDTHVMKTRSFTDTHPLRVEWLNRWLDN